MTDLKPTVPLPVEECRWLRDKGFPQTNMTACWDVGHYDDPGDDLVYYRVWNGSCCESGYHDWDSCWWGPTEKALACPDLEPLMEWASIKHGLILRANVAGDVFKDWSALSEAGQQEHRHPDPKLALIAMLKEVLGE